MPYHIERFISNDLFLNFSDNREDDGLEIIITVSSDAEVDLLGVGIVSVSNADAKDGVGRSHRNLGKDIVEADAPGEGGSSQSNCSHRRQTKDILVNCVI